MRCGPPEKHLCKAEVSIFYSCLLRQETCDIGPAEDIILSKQLEEAVSVFRVHLNRMISLHSILECQVYDRCSSRHFRKQQHASSAEIAYMYRCTIFFLSDAKYTSCASLQFWSICQSCIGQPLCLLVLVRNREEGCCMHGDLLGPLIENIL